VKMLRKLVIFAFLSIFCAAFLASCHGSKEINETSVPTNFDASKSYEITFWAKNENNATQRGVYDAAIERFEQIYPNISVTIKHYTSYDDIYNDVITNIQTSTTPNVCITYPDHIATYITGEDVVVPLDELIANERYGFGGSEVKFDSPKYSDMVSEFMDECYIGDELYALPFMRSTEACYINKTYVEALGYTLPSVLTWDFVFEVSNAALAKNPDGTYAVNNQKVMIPFIYKSTDNMMIQMLRQKGAGYSNDSGKIEMFNDTTRQLLKMVAENTATGAFSTFKISSYPGNYLNKGQCIFAVDSTAGATWMGSDAPLIDVPESALREFETVVMPIPQFDEKNPVMISQGPSLCIFNKEDSGEVMASWLFVQYLLSNDTQIAYAQTEGYVPVTTKAQQSSEYQEYLSRSGEDNELYYNVKIDAAKMLLDNVENTFTTAVFNGSTSLRNAAGEMIEKVAKSIRRKEKVDDRYITRLFADVRSLYRLDQVEASASKTKLGPLPPLSIALLCALAVIWVGIASYVLIPKILKTKNKKTPTDIDIR